MSLSLSFSFSLSLFRSGIQSVIKLKTSFIKCEVLFVSPSRQPGRAAAARRAAGGAPIFHAIADSNLALQSFKLVKFWKSLCTFRTCHLSQQESYNRLRLAFHDEAPTLVTVYNWFNKFNRGRTVTSDDLRNGRPTVTTEDDISVVRPCQTLTYKTRVTYQQIQTNIGINCVHRSDTHSYVTRLGLPLKPPPPPPAVSRRLREGAFITAEPPAARRASTRYKRPFPLFQLRNIRFPPPQCFFTANMADSPLRC
ncbi:hypothetical protein EVAR_79680_1 [Eumeta japonica]|uniref:Mos1 transposase HTH domain-containing protein n=1 Tax=Eumeta variegata TaxID=151549 RepID=A0A4C1T8Y9_EUMVA|nr:hypothetical protein EVAR_79680_1 [Eumeta japonica]